MLNKITTWFYLLCACVFLTSCAGGTKFKTYVDEADKNMTIYAESESSSFFSDLSAYIQVYQISVKDKCWGEYLGTVELEENAVKIGLPVNEPRYLAFFFTDEKAGGYAVRHISKFMVITAKPGYQYKAEVSYKEGIHYIEVIEKDGNKERQLPFAKLSRCKQQ